MYWVKHYCKAAARAYYGVEQFALDLKEGGRWESVGHKGERAPLTLRFTNSFKGSSSGVKVYNAYLHTPHPDTDGRSFCPQVNSQFFRYWHTVLLFLLKGYSFIPPASSTIGFGQRSKRGGRCSSIGLGLLSVV